MPCAPLIALTVGDPAGIGPEISLHALAERAVREEMRLLVLGPGALRPAAVPEVRSPEEMAAGREVAWLGTAVAGEWTMGRAQASAGRAALAALRSGAELALARRVDALVTAPVSKEALHLAGEKVEGQTELLGRWAGAPGVQMLAVAEQLRVLVHTRHRSLREAIAALDASEIAGNLAVLDRGLRRLGIAAPRLALAGLNPHASEGGRFGDEEARILAPAAARARERGLDVAGPEPPDTVFLRAARGEFAGVLALYHDQGFIPVKLLAPDTGVTVLLEIPYLRVSPVHGTAFDLAGRGLARPANLIAALRQAARWAR
ncbi:MAG: 4-hydroxythreonine-4-phosphate dehydrogenase PdxA [Planctomycetota bacterium]